MVDMGAMQQRPIRQLEVAREDLNCDVASHLCDLLREISEVPGRAKEVRGTIVTAFPSFDADPRPDYVIPEIRAFIQSLDAELPHIAYFLFGDPALAHIEFYLQCLVDVSDESGHYRAHDLLAVARDRAEAITRFCHEITDDAERAIEPLMLNLPPEVLRIDPDLATTVLDRLRPTLELFRDEDPDGPVAAEFAAMVFDRAARLLGLDHSSSDSFDELRRHVFEQMP